MRLRKFRVQAFRCIHDSGDVVVGDLAAFVGRNESGKTTILQALTLLNKEEVVSDLDLCDEMTERLKSEIPIVEGDFDLNHDEIEIIKEKFPDLELKKLKIFRTNKNPEIQYDFGGANIDEKEDENLKHWQNITKQLSTFVESIPNYISKKLDTYFFTANMPSSKKDIQGELDDFDNNIQNIAKDEQEILTEWEKTYTDIVKNIDKISKDSQTIIIVGKNDKNTFPILSINYHEMLVKRDLKSDLFVIEGKHSSGSLINASKIIKKFID